MYICLCHTVTDKDIVQAINEGTQSLSEMMVKLKVATQCGGCLNDVMQIIHQYQQDGTVSDLISHTSLPEVKKTSIGIFRPAVQA
ncbi:MAG: (2Fe-2S)-binding protein [Ostreibacterium sp.]